ncbi:hypothetical protein BBF96_15225 [Anoxybacter fermentans]|uniref:BCE-2095-like N-terminal domain-containing protein n=1 Tax=Anoxybacter fermentans TaxID=1323375 RepID=A0A3S9T238_9FIRM|nr:hypothetical protein [Anoxybacter fermentans]AZR74607.1 hypothetical protein BBF96_15225 [Anoxybacter fermentans]
MGNITFNTLQKQIFDYYGKSEFREALEVAKLALENFPEKMSRISYWIACLYCRLGEIEEAIKTLKSAVEKGCWWAPQILLNDWDLKPIHDRDEFKNILSESEKLYAIAQSKTKAELLIFTPEEYTQSQPIPLFFSIHWRQGNARSFADYWKTTVLGRGFMLALPQSSQVCGIDEFCWDDQALAKKDILEMYAKIRRDYTIKFDQTIIAGASQGGKLAIDLVLNDEIPSKGFIAVMPAIGDVEEYVPLIESAAKRGIKGCIVIGDNDYFYPRVMELYAEIQKRNLPCKLMVEKRLGHSFPEDFYIKLTSAIDFILE